MEVWCKIMTVTFQLTVPRININCYQAQSRPAMMGYYLFLVIILYFENHGREIIPTINTQLLLA